MTSNVERGGGGLEGIAGEVEVDFGLGAEGGAEAFAQVHAERALWFEARREGGGEGVAILSPSARAQRAERAPMAAEVDDMRTRGCARSFGGRAPELSLVTRYVRLCPATCLESERPELHSAAIHDHHAESSEPEALERRP